MTEFVLKLLWVITSFCAVGLLLIQILKVAVLAIFIAGGKREEAKDLTDSFIGPVVSMIIFGWTSVMSYNLVWN